MHAIRNAIWWWGKRNRCSARLKGEGDHWKKKSERRKSGTVTMTDLLT